MEIIRIIDWSCRVCHAVSGKPSGAIITFHLPLSRRIFLVIIFVKLQLPCIKYTMRQIQSIWGWFTVDDASVILLGDLWQQHSECKPKYLLSVVPNECECVFHAIIVMIILICGWKPGKIAFYLLVLSRSRRCSGWLII